MTAQADGDLPGTLETVRSRIDDASSRRRHIGEQNTKATLIEPVLAALGWNLHELDEVTREYRQKPQDNPVDYALFILGSPRLFIEAKEIGTNLEDRKWVSQILSYATVAGVEWCVLTDGNAYRIYNSHAPVDVEEKLFRSVEISYTARSDYVIDTLKLLSKSYLERNQIDALWRAHHIDQQVRIALKEILDPDNQSLVRMIRSRVSDLKPAEVRDSIQRARIKIEYPLLPGVPPQPPEPEPSPKPSSLVTINDLIDAGMIRPPLELERTYKGVHLTAVIDVEGNVIYDGEKYNSVSTAGGMARKSVVGAPSGRKYPQTNGWIFWKYRDPETGDLLIVDHLRQEYLNSRQSSPNS